MSRAGGEVDLVFRRPDGAEVPVIVSASPVRDAGGEVALYVETVKDVTARRAAEQALAAERDHAAGIVASLHDGLVVASLDGRILEANDQFLRMVGLRREQVVGVTGPPYPWWVPEDEPQMRDLLGGVMEGRRGEFEVSFRRPSGVVFPVAVSVASRSGPDGQDLGLVATYRDIGPWREAQEEARRREAAQRESEALLAAEREAQRLKDEFLAMVSHELRTPLSAVVGTWSWRSPTPAIRTCATCWRWPSGTATG